MTLNDLIIKIQKIPAASKVFLLQNLAVMIKTGIPLADGLKILGEQTNHLRLKKILHELGEKIRQGQSFGESLMPYEKDFGELFINMVKAGEVSGRLEEVLKQLYLQTKKDYELKTKVRNALIYPTVILVAMIGIAGFVILFVLPNITSLFSDLDVELPIATKILISISLFVQRNGPLTLISILTTLIVAIKLIRTKKGKEIIDSLILKLPIISSIVKKINLARMSRSLSSLLRTDIDIINTLNITSHVLGNSKYKKALSESSEKVKKGQKLEVIFKEYPTLFPPIITQMIAVGEETGSLDEILESVAGFYEEEISQTMDSLPTIIEPILMILIGMGVGGVALAILTPIFSLTQTF